LSELFKIVDHAFVEGVDNDSASVDVFEITQDLHVLVDEYFGLTLHCLHLADDVSEKLGVHLLYLGQTLHVRVQLVVVLWLYAGQCLVIVQVEQTHLHQSLDPLIKDQVSDLGVFVA